MFGMLVGRTRFGHCGGITIPVRCLFFFFNPKQNWVLLLTTRPHFNTGTQGLIFVVDSNDTARLDEARSELHKIINDREMKDALLLVFANKQDIPGSKCRVLICSFK